MKAWKSGIWSLTGQAVNLTVTLGSLAVLGRLLTPAEFGLFGLVLAVQAVVAPLLDMGLLPAYLKLEKAEGQAADAFFTVNFLVGSIIAGLLVVLAPWLADYYNAPQLKPLITVISFSIVLRALAGQPFAVLNREKKFDKIFQVNILVLVSGVSLAVLLAWLGYGVWALVWRVMFESVARLFLLVILSGRKYRLVGISTIRPYSRNLKFGLEIVMSRFISGWVNSIDKLVLGKFVSLGEIGGYTKAQQFALMPHANISMALTTPALAYLARIKSLNKLNDYLLLNAIVLLMAGTPCLIIMVYGDVLFPLVLGEQWRGSGWIFQWMGLYGLARVLFGLSVIYNIDNKTVYRTTKCILGSVFIVLPVPFMLLYSTEELYWFIVSLSVISTIYWFIVLLVGLIVDYRDAVFTITSFFTRIVTVLLLSVGSVLYFKQTSGCGVLLSIIFGCLLIVVAVFLFFMLFNPGMTRRLYRMVWSNS